MDHEVNNSDFRLFLQSQFETRSQKNPRYSLRSFAKFLNVESSTLSQIIRGKRKLSLRTIETFGQRLELSPSDIMRYKYSHTFSRQQSTINDLNQQDTYQELATDMFRVISDWYHFAIIELMRTVDFKPDTKWIASRLDVPQAQVYIAVERLQRTGFIEINDRGEWIDRAGHNTAIVDFKTDEAKRRVQRQMLELAIDALEQTPIDKRDQTTMTVAIDPKRLPEAREYITQFRRGLTKFLESDRKKSEVYHLSISLYPVTKSKEPKNGVTEVSNER